MNEINNMPDEFFEWLNDCPVTWHRLSCNDDTIEYLFEVPDQDEEQNEE